METKVSSNRSAIHSTFLELISNEHSIMVLFGVFVGVAGGYGAVGFRYLINFIQTIAYGTSTELLDVVALLRRPALAGIDLQRPVVLAFLPAYPAHEAQRPGAELEHLDPAGLERHVPLPVPAAGIEDLVPALDELLEFLERQGS